MSVPAAPRRPARVAHVARGWLAAALLVVPALSVAIEPTVPAERGGKSAVRPRIGRIFSAPSSRLGARTDGSQATPAALPAAGTSHQRTYVNGTLSIGSRPRAVWINGVPVDASSVRQGTHTVQPGQSIGRDGGIEDLLPSGSLTRR